MGGFPGPKRSFLVAIILAIKLDQVERDQEFVSREDGEWLLYDRA
jgi:hypothetical protein